MGYKFEVFVEGEWSSNQLVFETKEEAELYGINLASRWFLVTNGRSVEVTDPVNYKWDRTINKAVKL